MIGDRPISAEQAIEIQATAQREGVLLIWTITTGTSDFGDCYIARPYKIGKVGGPLRFVLLADTLESVREMLPPEMTWMGRQEADDNVIVESWI